MRIPFNCCDSRLPRRPALGSLPLAGVSLLLAVAAANPYFAVAMLAACFACIELSPYWAALMHVAGADTMSAGGVLNTGGNAGGLIAIPIIAYLSGHHAWTPAFILGALFAFAAGAAWLLIDPMRPSVSSRVNVRSEGD